MPGGNLPIGGALGAGVAASKPAANVKERHENTRRFIKVATSIAIDRFVSVPSRRLYK